MADQARIRCAPFNFDASQHGERSGALREFRCSSGEQIAPVDRSVVARDERRIH